jgi:O-antigen/teichoic acid export membrane protein
MKNKQTHLENTLKIIVRSSFIIFIGLFLSKAFTFLYRIIIARYYDSSVYGLFTLSFMIVTWIILICSFGLYDSIARYIPFYRGREQNNKIRYLVQNSLRLLTIVGIISGILLFLCSNLIGSFFNSEDLNIFLKIFAFSIPFLIILDVLHIIILSFENATAYSLIYNIFQSGIKPLLLIIFIFIGLGGIISVSFSFTIGSILSMILIYIYFLKKFPDIFWNYTIYKKDKFEINKEIFIYAFPLLLTNIVGGIFSSIDSFLLGHFKTVSDVGLYNSALTIATLLLVTPILFIKLFFPLIMKEYSKKNIFIISELSKQVTKWIFLINFPIFILMILFPGVIINLLFGKEYLFASNGLRILLIGNLISSVFMISIYLVSMIGKSKINLINTIICSILNLILNFILIPLPKIFGIDNNFGLIGAALSNTISTISFSILFIIEARYYTTILPIRKKMLNIILSTLPPAILIYFLRNIFTMNIIRILLLTILFFCIYIILLFVTKSLDKNDFMILNSIKNKFFSKNNKKIK